MKHYDGSAIHNHGSAKSEIQGTRNLFKSNGRMKAACFQKLLLVRCAWYVPGCSNPKHKAKSTCQTCSKSRFWSGHLNFLTSCETAQDFTRTESFLPRLCRSEKIKSLIHSYKRLQAVVDVKGGDTWN